jgi:hypothetical protein
MLDFQCWICGEAINRDDENAVLLSIGGLWRWAEGRRGADDPCQDIYLHSHCAKDRLAGATMEFEPSAFGEED